jgi:hypothetical protein
VSLAVYLGKSRTRPGSTVICDARLSMETRQGVRRGRLFDRETSTVCLCEALDLDFDFGHQLLRPCSMTWH